MERMENEKLSFYIGTDNGSGLRYDNLDDFLDGIRELVERAFDEGDSNFEVNFSSLPF